MSDAAPEFGERAFGSLPSTLGQTAGEHRRVDRPCARRADAFERNALVLEQAVEDTPGKGAVRAAALQGKVDRLDLNPWGPHPGEAGLQPRSPRCRPSCLLLVAAPMRSKVAPAVHEEMYGAGLTGGNAD